MELTVGVELALSDSWSGVGNFRLELVNALIVRIEIATS